MNVRSFLLQQGLIEPHDTPGPSLQYRITCPECGHHNKKCYVSAEGKGISCFHCGLAIGWRRFTRRYEPPTPQEVGLESFVEACQARLQQTEYWNYLLGRGLSEGTLKTAKIGLCDDTIEPNSNHEAAKLTYSSGKFILQNRIIIPYLSDGIITTIRGRALPETQLEHDKKYEGLPKSQAIPYVPTGKTSYIDPLFIVEGELNSLYLSQEGYQAQGIPGCNTFKPEWFSQFKNLYSCLDGDEPGRQASDKIIPQISEVRKVDLPDPYGADEYIQTFGKESFNKLVEGAELYVQGKPQRDDKFSLLVDDFSNWAWTNGEILGPRILWSPKLEEAFSGWSPGLTLIGANSQAGKSRWMCKALYQMCVENPDDTIGVYLSYDDTIRDTAAMILALHSQLPQNDVRIPRWSFDHPTNPDKKSPEKLKQYIEAVNTLKEIKNLVVRDASYGRSMDYLRHFFGSLRQKYQDKKIVVFVDSLAKITPDQTETPSESGESKGTNFKAYLAKELKHLTNIHNIGLVIPTDLRKLNGKIRPTLDDFKDAAELRYEATNAVLIYNDMNEYGDSSQMYWTLPDDPTAKHYPVIEFIIGKNKATGMQTTIRYKALPPLSDFEECSEEENFYYNRLASEQKEQMFANRKKQ